MTTRSAERQQMYEDIITTAVEGGTGYWAQVSQYQYTFNGEVSICIGEQEGDVTRAVLHEMLDDESGYKAEGMVLTGDVIASGFGVLRALKDKGDTINGRPALSTADGKPAHISVDYRKKLLGEYADPASADFDAADADVIVQLALLGRIVYG